MFILNLKEKLKELKDNHIDECYFEYRISYIKGDNDSEHLDGKYFYNMSGGISSLSKFLIDFSMDLLKAFALMHYYNAKAVHVKLEFEGKKENIERYIKEKFEETFSECESLL